MNTFLDQSGIELDSSGSRLFSPALNFPFSYLSNSKTGRKVHGISPTKHRMERKILFDILAARAQKYLGPDAGL
jgi:hypothetical protein